MIIDHLSPTPHWVWVPRGEINPSPGSTYGQRHIVKPWAVRHPRDGDSLPLGGGVNRPVGLGWDAAGTSSTESAELAWVLEEPTRCGVATLARVGSLFPMKGSVVWELCPWEFLIRRCRTTRGTLGHVLGASQSLSEATSLV